MAQGSMEIDEPPEQISITYELDAAQGWTGVIVDGTLVNIHPRYHPDPEPRCPLQALADLGLGRRQGRNGPQAA